MKLLQKKSFSYSHISAKIEKNTHTSGTLRKMIKSPHYMSLVSSCTITSVTIVSESVCFPSFDCLCAFLLPSFLFPLGNNNTAYANQGGMAPCHPQSIKRDCNVEWGFLGLDLCPSLSHTLS